LAASRLLLDARAEHLGAGIPTGGVMKKELIIRAWKDPAFRASLSTEERATLPESPSGRSMTELEESELGEISGGGVPGGTNYSVDTFRCPAPTYFCPPPRTINSCGIVACV
jgi:mersacidin/lichenicidin family type 2 lantibiotic